MIDATPRPPRRTSQPQPSQHEFPSSRAESNFMSHQDIVRYPASRGPAQQPQAQQAADDLWMQQQALAVAGQAPQPSMLAHGGGGGGGNDVQPLKIVHRTLRGRYKLAILLAAIGATVGTAVGWTQNEKVYRAKGTIRVDPQIRYATGTADAQLEYSRFMGSEANFIKTSDLVTLAMQRPEWKNFPGTAGWSAPEFISRLTSTYGTTQYDIAVTFDHPNRELAQTAITAVLEAYKDYRDQQRTQQTTEGVDYFRGEQTRLTNELAEKNRQRIEIQRKDSEGDLEASITAAAQRRAGKFAALQDAQFLLAQMNDIKTAAATTPPKISEQDLARREPVLARLLDERNGLEADLASKEKTYGINAPIVRNEQQMLDSINSRITTISQTLAQGVYGVIQPAVATGPNGSTNPPIDVTDETIATQQREVTRLQREFDVISSGVKTASDVRASLALIAADITADQEKLRDVNDKLADAQTRSVTVNAPVRTFTNPLVDVAEDKRPSMATFGFAAGGALPLLGLVAWGLFDRKYRYSDETLQTGSTRGVPLLGILPNLPDRLSDPSQASVAAHCVHQIRTMLQLNVLGEDPSVLSVTSATSGDGKTSLSLALGLSFAASGSRTLLIDTDLIGAGLSARMGIREPHGIGEAVASNNPMSYIRDTDINGLQLLPVGSEGGQNASTFSPSAVRRLIAAVRPHFDIVLIDTGPVLGSIEATPVVAASDAVILTVARGQNRDLVEKAIGHLRAIGARIAGVVFNKANAGDFERSISGISLRSVSRASSMNGNGVNGHGSVNGQRQDKRLGPLVHSVRGTREDSN